jgi:hypothetical protein
MYEKLHLTNILNLEGESTWNISSSMSVCVKIGNRRQLTDYSGKSGLAVKGFASGFRTNTLKLRKKLNYARFDEKFLHVEM